MRELEALIRDIDREIERAFEETFEATAKNFEEMVEHLFPGGRGACAGSALRPVRDAERPERRAGGADRRRAGARGGGGRAARGARGRDRGHPGRQVDPQALAALRRREVAGRAGLRLRRLPRPALPLLHPRRGRGRPRRRQHRPLPAADPALLRPRPVRHRHPPETDDGRRRRPLRGHAWAATASPRSSPAACRATVAEERATGDATDEARRGRAAATLSAVSLKPRTDFVGGYPGTRCRPVRLRQGREERMAQRHMDRLTSFDTSFLANEKSNGHMAIGALLVCEGSAPSEDDFLAHIRSRLHLLPRLRQRLALPAAAGSARRSGSTTRTSTSTSTCAASRCRRPGTEAQFHEPGRRVPGAAARPLEAALGADPGRGLRGRPLRDRLQDPPRDGRRDLGGRHRHAALRRRAEARAGPRRGALDAARAALAAAPCSAAPAPASSARSRGCGALAAARAAASPGRARRRAADGLAGLWEVTWNLAKPAPKVAVQHRDRPARAASAWATFDLADFKHDQERPRRHRQRRHPGGRRRRPAALAAGARRRRRRARAEGAGAGLDPHRKRARRARQQTDRDARAAAGRHRRPGRAPARRHRGDGRAQGLQAAARRGSDLGPQRLVPRLRAAAPARPDRGDQLLDPALQPAGHQLPRARRSPSTCSAAS